MYQDYYQLRDMPFENTPDPRFFFASEQHREALAAIEYTIRMRKGFVLVTGEIGSGKTTVSRTVCQRCQDQATIVSLLHGHQEPGELLRQILRAMDVPHRRSDDRPHLLEMVSEQLTERMQIGKPVVLFIDDAQTFSDDALDELRLFSNFDTATQKMVQMVLVGQPELRQRIRHPKLAALRQRIVVAKQVGPMSLIEVGQYIAHRIASASIDTQAPAVRFAGEAVSEIYQQTGGIPRLINVVCDNCLLLGFVKEAREIVPAMVRRVVEDMVPSFTEPVGETESAPLALAGNF